MCMFYVVQMWHQAEAISDFQNRSRYSASSKPGEESLQARLLKIIYSSKARRSLSVR